METVPETARDYLLAAMRGLIAEIDAFESLSLAERIDAIRSDRFSPDMWIGHATAVLKEITRDA